MKHNTETLTTLLKTKNILLLEEFKTMNSKVLVRCVIDDFEWSSTPKLLVKTQCKKCIKIKNSLKSQNKNLKKLKEKKIILLSDYDPYSLLKFKCKTHDNEWQSTINNTIKSGCEICSGKKKWYKETVVEYLKSKNITLLSEYKNTTGKITVRCENDKHIWDTKFKHIQQSNKTGCPKCAGNIKYTQTEIDVILQKLNIIRNSEFVNVKTKMDFQCKKCDYLWTTNPTSVLNEKSGCAKCGKRPNYTNEDIEK